MHQFFITFAREPKTRNMNQFHLTLNENSPAIQWANTQADKIGAKGHVGTHLDCYTTVPEQKEYLLSAIVLDCRSGMPHCKDIQDLPALKNKALILHTGNLEKNEYGSEKYFLKNTSLTDEVLKEILNKEPVFIILDSHGIAEKGAKHIAFDKQCEECGCHVIENADFSSLKDETEIELLIRINISHPSTGKPCELYRK